MVILDIDMPESCLKCPLMRCGMCIAKNSMKVTNYEAVRHPGCPVMCDISEYKITCEKRDRETTEDTYDKVTPEDVQRINELKKKGARNE